MYTPKYPYKTLTRVPTEHGRFYDVSGERLLPSVTTILSHVEDQSWLEEWRERIGHAAAEKITHESIKIGQDMHDILECHYTGEPLRKTLPLSRIYADVIKKKGLSRVSEVWGVEAPLFNPELYAGTSDLIGVHDNIPSIMDYKNARHDKCKEDIESYFMQLVAYAEAHNITFGTTINRGVIMMMSRTGNYLEFIIEGKEFDKYTDMWYGKLEQYYTEYGIVC